MFNQLLKISVIYIFDFFPKDKTHQDKQQRGHHHKHHAEQSAKDSEDAPDPDKRVHTKKGRQEAKRNDPSARRKGPPELLMANMPVAVSEKRRHAQQVILIIPLMIE